MKLPDLKSLKRGPKAKDNAPKPAARPRAEVRVPRFLEDLYRDMRDRRLLLPAALLIVAIVAVPVALSASKEDPPAAMAVAPPEGADAVAPAVLTEELGGVRDYRERLDQLKSKNPFGDLDVTEPAASSDPADIIVSPSDTPTTTAPTTSPSPPTPADVPDSSGGSTEPPPVDDGDSGDQHLVLAPRIDVRTGAKGKPRKRIDDVEPGELLPNRRKAPVVMFLGAGKKYAHFAVSGGVTQTEGDGRCRPRPRQCEFLRLAEGERRTFVYGPDSKRFSLKVINIREEIVDRKVEGK